LCSLNVEQKLTLLIMGEKVEGSKIDKMNRILRKIKCAMVCILRRTFDEEFNLIQHGLRIPLRKS